MAQHDKALKPITLALVEYAASQASIALSSVNLWDLF